uniref:Uncharacterized protein n=1 Tax=Anguilla anguilla TaxID=7936 RepID=A0A0E9RSF4_ANGAN
MVWYLGYDQCMHARTCMHPCTQRALQRADNT